MDPDPINLLPPLEEDTSPALSMPKLPMPFKKANLDGTVDIGTLHASMEALQPQLASVQFVEPHAAAWPAPQPAEGYAEGTGEMLAEIDWAGELAEMKEQLRQLMEGQSSMQEVLHKVHDRVEDAGPGKWLLPVEPAYAVQVPAAGPAMPPRLPSPQRRSPGWGVQLATDAPEPPMLEAVENFEIENLKDGLVTPADALAKAKSSSFNAGMTSVNSLAKGALAIERLSTGSVSSKGEPPTRCSFASSFRTAADDKKDLLKCFRITEKQDDEKEKAKEARGCRKRFLALYQHDAELVLDSAFSGLIILNSIFIGALMDRENPEDYKTESGRLFLALDIAFSAAFTLELIIKLSINGCRKQFCGPHRWANLFDASLIFIDMMQLFLRLALPGNNSLRDAPSASLFRLIRLAKLARILRLVKSEVFQDLLAMIQGMLGGMTTLSWAMLLFLLAVYVVALLCREALGNGSVENVSDYFDSVPRSMFTTFRCAFGDCSSANGVPISEYVDREYGPMFSVLYCMFIFITTIGLFNVISAVFVESTMAAAADIQSKKKKARLADDVLWSTRITSLIRRLMHTWPGSPLSSDVLSTCIDELYEFDIPKDVIDELGKDPEARKALCDLDVNDDDHDRLADVLDPDNGGSITVMELVEGVKRLRGDPRRSDIVAVDLMLRSIQRSVDKILSEVGFMHKMAKKEKRRSSPSASRDFGAAKRMCTTKSMSC
eukprot:TRINITY_DN29966_c0_g1_i1.p1 TRINITY_DN29966_c0_g1~~TRINITY_DN29966_c0_g1_i1.p1  ORF type:complete len:719 (+),score=150.88 TRINITY_DN29966_c0_g1_i1:73-2229(+)